MKTYNTVHTAKNLLQLQLKCQSNCIKICLNLRNKLLHKPIKCLRKYDDMSKKYRFLWYKCFKDRQSLWIMMSLSTTLENIVKVQKACLVDCR